MNNDIKNQPQTTPQPDSPANPGYHAIKLLRWRGNENRGGVIAVTPCGEEALRTFLENGGVAGARGRPGLLCVKEIWAEAILMILTLHLVEGAEPATCDLLTRVVKKLLNEGIEASFRRNASAGN